MKTRTINFAGHCVAVIYEGEHLSGVLKYLFQDLNEEVDKPAEVIFSMKYLATGKIYCLSRDEVEIYQGKSKSEMASMLMDQVLFHLVSPNAEGLLLHCAVLERNGVGIVLPGTSGAGKSTLSAWLTHQGFHYLTDELAFVPNGSNKIHSFTRPFNIKTRALKVIRESLDVDVSSDELLSNDRATLIPHRNVNEAYQYSTPELGVILFPRFQAMADYQLSSISPALAGLELMKCLINARNIEGDGFPEIVRIVKATSNYSMVYGGYEQLGEELFEILGT